MTSTAPRSVAILIFDDVEVLDFCGPFEAFSVAGFVEGETPFTVSLVAQTTDPVRARNGLRVIPDATLDDCRAPDVLVIPGGPGTRPQLENKRLLQWLQTMVTDERTTVSVCSGALLLGHAGLLDGLETTTHHRAIDELRKLAPAARVHTDKRYIWNDNLVIAAGVSSGIDASLDVVRRFCGEAMASSTAKYMEYDWRRVN